MAKQVKKLVLDVNKISNNDLHTSIIYGSNVSQVFQTVIAFDVYVKLTRIGAQSRAYNGTVFDFGPTTLTIQGNPFTPPDKIVNSLALASFFYNVAPVWYFGPSAAPLTVNLLLSPRVDYTLTASYFGSLAGVFIWDTTIFVEWQLLGS